MMNFTIFSDKDEERQEESVQDEKISHTGSGGAFDGTEAPAREEDRDMSDEQLDERLENKEPKQQRPPAY
jgi:hypothetical protein